MPRVIHSDRDRKADHETEKSKEQPAIGKTQHERFIETARELGCNIVINTDSHHISHLDAMHYGIKQLRRAWFTKADVLNSRPVEEFLAGLRRNQA